MITVHVNSTTSHTYIPSSLKWSLQDVSASDSGRDGTAKMHKKRIGQKRKLQLEFKGLKWAEASQIMNDFNPEYIDVTYPDIMSGKMETKNFYTGDREAEFYVWYENKKILSSVTFNIIER